MQLEILQHLATHLGTSLVNFELCCGSCVRATHGVAEEAVGHCCPSFIAGRAGRASLVVDIKLTFGGFGEENILLCMSRGNHEPGKMSHSMQVSCVLLSERVILHGLIDRRMILRWGRSETTC